MMKDGDEIRVPLLSGPKAWITLQGSILSYREKFWSCESTVDIPLELVSFTEKKQLKGSRLIAALLSLLFLPGIGGTIIALWYLFAGKPSDTVISIWYGYVCHSHILHIPFPAGPFLHPAEDHHYSCCSRRHDYYLLGRQ